MFLTSVCALWYWALYHLGLLLVGALDADDDFVFVARALNPDRPPSAPGMSAHREPEDHPRRLRHSACDGTEFSKARQKSARAFPRGILREAAAV